MEQASGSWAPDSVMASSPSHHLSSERPRWPPDHGETRPGQAKRAVKRPAQTVLSVSDALSIRKAPAACHAQAKARATDWLDSKSRESSARLCAGVRLCSLPWGACRMSPRRGQKQTLCGPCAHGSAKRARRPGERRRRWVSGRTDILIPIAVRAMVSGWSLHGRPFGLARARAWVA